MAGIVNGLPNEESIRLGDNIRLLREYEKESREQLGLAINLSGSMIAQIENGTRNANKSVLYSIAKHYKVSLSSLKNEVITFKMLEEKDDCFDTQVTNDIVFLLIPFFENQSSGESKYFDNAIEELKYATKSDGTLIGHRVESIRNNFYKAYKDDNIIEAAQNTIFMILCEYGSIGGSTDMITKYTSGTITKMEMDIAGDAIYESLSSAQKEYILKYEDLYSECLKALKNNEHYKDLAEFDLAIRYYFSFVSNDELPEKNLNFGMMLVWDLANCFDNKYAKALIDKIMQIEL